ncbi:hypothetical protein FRC03_011598 [Tulasnella sp. 419]|nr:hypothetical protein FRC03_011598 [Tulasnella sp. 419]
MTGHHPFRNYETQREIDRFLEQNPESAVPGNPSEYKELPPTSPLWSLMFQCWELNVSHRPAMAVVHRRLEEMKSYNHGQADVTLTTENQGINAARVALNLLATANPMDRSLGFPMGLVRPSTSLAPVLSTGIHTGAFS